MAIALAHPGTAQSPWQNPKTASVRRHSQTQALGPTRPRAARIVKKFIRAEPEWLISDKIKASDRTRDISSESKLSRMRVPHISPYIRWQSRGVGKNVTVKAYNFNR